MTAAVLPSLHGYRRAWARRDLLAGLTVWAVLVPEALAYATIAGVSPVVGLYAAPGALLLYALLGSSRVLVTGPMSATAALSAATVADVVASDGGAFATATAALAITAGGAALVAGALRLGFLASFISAPVIKGFIVGLALTILVGQLPKLLGVERGEGDFFEQAWDLLGRLGRTDGLTLLVGALSLAVVLGLRRAAPAAPGSLVAVALGDAAVAALSLDDHGLAIVGPIEGGLPELGVPDAALDTYGALVAGGVGVMLVAAGLSSGMVVNGSLSKTAVNASAGARSQLAGVVVAVLTVLTLLLLTGLFEQLPEATLAAIVIAAVVELVDVPGLARLYRIYAGRRAGPLALGARPDFVAAVAALLGVLVFDTLPGLFIGIGASLLLLLYRASRPHVAVLGRVPGTPDQYGDVRRHPENVVPDGVAILRVESGLFFANADVVRRRVLRAAEGNRAVVLDAETVPFVDVTAASMLADLRDDLARRGVRLVLARDVGHVRDVLRRADADGLAGVSPSVQAAVEAVTRA